MSAVFSPCRTWRYTLTRNLPVTPVEAVDALRETGEFVLDHAPRRTRTVAFIGLNPSTADETEDDPTIRRCVGFARSWGYDRMVMLNAFALRSTDPKVLIDHLSPVGPQNDYHLLREVGGADLVVCAWGVHGRLIPRLSREPRGEQVRRMLAGEGGKKLHVLGLTKDGHPKHPLYLRGDLEPVVWDG